MKVIIVEGEECDICMNEEAEKLDKIGLVLSASRSEAIAGRQSSGIEDEWLEDEEYYEGIDDANRSELKAWRGKPLGQQVIMDEDQESQGSTIFLNITRAYCDAVSARMGDMMLPTDDKGWAIRPTPKPDLEKLASGTLPKDMEDTINKSSDDPQDQQTQKASAIEQAEKIVIRAKESAEKAEKQIWDWHIESQYTAQNRRLIEDAAKVGSGILKGPIPTRTSKLVFIDGELKQVAETKPASLRISYRNFFPDPACGENIHNGNYTWERDDITRAKLLKLRGVRGYIESQLSKVIKEGPSVAAKEYVTDDDNPGLKNDTESMNNLFEIWYYHGTMKKSDLLSIDIMSEKTDMSYDSEEDFVHVQVTMVNNRVIKATISHLENGEFPYDVMVWQRRLGMPWGIGVARQIRPAQRIIVGAMRHMMDNAGIAGGPMLYIDTNIVQAADGPNEVRPWKVFIAADDMEPGKVSPREGIQFIKAPMIQKELQSIIELGLQLAEDITGLPIIMQGQTNQRTPETLGGMMLQNHNASSVLRRVARLYDDIVTTPHIRRYYKYILQYSDDDSMKGDFNIDARGSSALIEKDAANQAMLQIGQYVMNPLFKKDPAKWLDNVLKANHIDPDKIAYDDEEWKGIVEGMAQGQPDPKLEIAQLQQQTAMQLDQSQKQFAAQMKQVDLEAKRDSDTRSAEITMSKAQLEAMSKEKDRQVTLAIEEMKTELQMILVNAKEEGDSARQVEKLKQKIQDTVLKLQTQVSLNDTQVTTPPVEPKGRAPDGQAYSK